MLSILCKNNIKLNDFDMPDEAKQLFGLNLYFFKDQKTFKNANHLIYNDGSARRTTTRRTTTRGTTTRGTTTRGTTTR